MLTVTVNRFEDRIDILISGKDQEKLPGISNILDGKGAEMHLMRTGKPLVR